MLASTGVLAAYPAEGNPLRGEAEDPFDLVHSAQLRDGQVTGYSATDLPGSAFSQGGAEALASGAAKADSAADRPRDKSILSCAAKSPPPDWPRPSRP